MKRKVLMCMFSFLSLITFSAVAQTDKSGSACENCGNVTRKTSPELSIFPNPAQDFIGITQEDLVGRILVYNMVGRKMKTFEVEKGEKYDIADLPHGMYLIQLVGKNNKVLLTQRLSKRA
jgi:Secretion system C-terminal sorting domain